MVSHQWITPHHRNHHRLWRSYSHFLLEQVVQHRSLLPSRHRYRLSYKIHNMGATRAPKQDMVVCNLGYNAIALYSNLVAARTKSLIRTSINISGQDIVFVHRLFDIPRCYGRYSPTDENLITIFICPPSRASSENTKARALDTSRKFFDVIS